MSRGRKQVNIAEAKAHFSELVQRASMGEEVVIAKDNRPLAKLVPLRPGTGKRRPGWASFAIARRARAVRRGIPCSRSTV